MELGLGQPTLADDANILSIDIPKEMENAIPMGHPHLDRLFAGDGIIAGTVTLVTGDPGAGKSTLMQSLGDSLTGKGHIAVYVTGEESVYQIRRVAKRLRLKNGFIVSHKTEAEEIIAHVERLRHKKENKGKKIFLIIDSLPCVRVHQEEGKRGRPLSEGKQAIVGLEMLTQYAKNNWMPLFMIGHVTKSGQFAGQQKIKHVVDCHLHLAIDVDPDTGMEERILEMQKNRFGSSGVAFVAEMTAHGLAFETDTSPMEQADFEDDE